MERTYEKEDKKCYDEKVEMRSKYEKTEEGKLEMKEEEKRKMRRLDEKAQDEQTQMRMKYEKAEKIKRRRRSRGEDGCGKK